MQAPNKTLPLTHWRCDVCGDQVDVEGGYVVWDEPGEPTHAFKIIHKIKCDRDDRNSSMALADFLGPDGLVTLTSMLSYGIAKRGDSKPEPPELEQFVDFLRRVQVPYYEESRRWLRSYDAREELHDASETYPYQQRNLQRFAKLPVSED